MAITAQFLKNIMAEARPIIERQMNDAKLIAGFRDVVANNGGDWGALKALIKAHVEDENDEKGPAKRVQKIREKADNTSAYADMLGLENMNENNFSSGPITETTPHSERSHDAARPSAPLESASGTISSINSPSDLVSEPAVATTPSPRAATADQFSRAPVESVPLHEQADVKIPGSNPRETRAGASGEGQRRPPNEVEPGPHSLSPSAGSSSLPSNLAGEVGKSSLASPAFSNPRCRKPDSCHYASNRDCCHDCLLAWGTKPRDEQRRLWQDAERAARECEVAA